MGCPWLIAGIISALLVGMGCKPSRECAPDGTGGDPDLRCCDGSRAWIRRGDSLGCFVPREDECTPFSAICGAAPCCSGTSCRTAVPNEPARCWESWDAGPEADAGVPDAAMDASAWDAGPPPITTAHVYVTVSGEDELVFFEIDDDSGDLTEQQRINTGNNPGALALSPDHSAVYVANRGDDAVQGYARDADTGRLTDLGATTVGENPVHLSVDATGGHLLWASYGGNRIQSHPIASDGTVQATATSGFESGTNPHAIRLHPGNAWAIVPNTNSDVIRVFAFDEGSGTLTMADPFETTASSGTGPRHLDFHPSSDFVVGSDLVYVVNEHADSVTRFLFDPDTGALTETETVSTLPATGADAASNTCADIHVHPTGNWLYASNRGHDSIAVVELDASGGMTPRDYVPTEPRPREFAISPDGLFLIAAGQDSGNLAVYRIDPDDGSLTRNDTVPVGPTPMWVEIVDAP